MQENNLVNRINLIFTSLKSKEIIDFLNQWNIDKLKLLSLVIESKIGYDRMISDDECKKFIDDIEEHVVYTTSEYGELIMFISSMGDSNAKVNNGAEILSKFQVFHKMLYKTGTLVIKLLNNKPAEIIPVVEKNSISNPLFIAKESGIPLVQEQIKVQEQPKIQENPFIQAQPVSDPKVFSIAQTAPTPVVEISHQKSTSKSAEVAEEEEMSLSYFLKSLATG